MAIQILGPLIQSTTSIIPSLLYAIFFLIVLENALILIPSEVIIPFSDFLVSGNHGEQAGTRWLFRDIVGSIAP